MAKSTNDDPNIVSHTVTVPAPAASSTLPCSAASLTTVPSFTVSSRHTATGATVSIGT